MNENAIAPLSQVQENIRNKIKAEFVNLIPDEMWTAMVESVVEDFTTGDRDQWGNRRQEPEIKRLIRSAIEDEVKTSIKAKMDELGASTWSSMGQRIMSEAMTKLIADHFDEVLASVNAGMVHLMINQAMNNLRHSIMR